MLKSCSRCGGIHESGYRCTHNRPKVTYRGGEERGLRNSYSWHKKSREIREHAQWLCEVCKDNNRYVYDGLEVHHIEKVKDNPAKLLDNMNLVCLCTLCHKQADRGDISPDYLRELARKREKTNI